MQQKKHKNNNIGILGFGEVGQAIAKFYDHPKIKDLKRDDGLAEVEILHVCLPWNQNFVKIVKNEIKKINKFDSARGAKINKFDSARGAKKNKFDSTRGAKKKPLLTIIHSTVAPGTTKKIISGLPRACRGVVHSPIRGVHPHLYEGIKVFIKYIGADNKKAGKLAKKHLASLGIKTKVFTPSLTTEIGKLLDTSYYGLCIAWHGDMKKLCDRYKINFQDAVTDFNETYNEGYKKLGKLNVIRPVLYPPQKTGGIKGHCVRENAKILKKYYKSKFLDLIN